MVQLLNSDGTVSFERIDNIRDNFEDAFAKKQLGAAMKDIIVKSVPDHVNKSNMFEDDNIKAILTNAISEIASTAYTEKELNGSAGYIGSLKETIKEYASMEADYRMEKAMAVYEANSDKVEASAEVRDIFSLENLKFSTEELKERFISEMEYKFGSEAEDIVTEIGKEVGVAIANAEEKNLIINETSKAITDQKKELEKELQVDDEEPEENEDNSGDETGGDSSQDLDGSETEFDNDEEDPDVDGANDTAEEIDDVGSESLDQSTEAFIGLTKEERRHAISLISKDKSRFCEDAAKVYERIYNKLKDIDEKNRKINSVEFPYKNKQEFKEAMEEVYEDTLGKLKTRNGFFNNGSEKMQIRLCDIKTIEKVKYILSLILACIPGIGILSIPIVVLDSDEENSREKISGLKDEIVNSSIDKYNGGWFDRAYIYIDYDFKKENVWYKIYLMVKFKPKNYFKFDQMSSKESFAFKVPKSVRSYATGVEEVDTVIESLKENIDDAIEEGQISIGTPDTTVHYQKPATTEPEQVSDYTNPDNEEFTDPSNTDGVTGEPEITEGEPEDNGVAIASTLSTPTLNNMSSEDYREYTDLVFGNENLGKTLVPLSPVKFDAFPDISTKALTAIYLRGVEGLSSLQNMMNARFELLNEIVSREEDETLTEKFNNYKKKSEEAFNDAIIVRDTLNTMGLDTRGVEDVNDKLSLFIGAKFLQFAKGNLKLSTYNAKKNWRSCEDGINAAFDLAILKNELRKAYNNKDSETMISLKNELGSRESLYYENLIGFEGDEEKKNAIANLIKLDDIDFSPEFVEVNKFTDSLRFAVDITKVKTTKPDKSDEEKNKEIYEKAKNRIEFITNKDLTSDQSEIINAMIEGRDISDYAPTPFEKFVLKIGEDHVKENRDFELGGESAGRIQDEACLRAVLYSFVNKTKPFSQESIDEFNDYLFGETA